MQTDVHRVLGGDRADDVRETIELRRLRLGAEARWRRLAAEVDVDPSDGRQWLKDAWVEVRSSPGFRLRGGWQKLPTLAGRDVGGSRTDFVERSVASGRLAPDRDAGLSVRVRHRRAELHVGAFAGDAFRRRERAGFTVAGRMELAPRDGVVLGVLATSGAVPDSSIPRGARAEGPSGLELWPRYPVTGRRVRLGGDAAWGGRGFRLGAELVRLRAPHPTGRPGDAELVVGTAWAVSAHWRRGGRRDDARGPFLERRRGALGLAVRVERAQLRDPVLDLVSRGLVATGGVGWRPLSFVLVMANLVHERADARDGTRRARTTALGRVQLEFR